MRAVFGVWLAVLVVGGHALAETREQVREEARAFYDSITFEGGQKALNDSTIATRVSKIASRPDAIQYLKVLKKAYVYSVRPTEGNSPGLGLDVHSAITLAETIAPRTDGDQYLKSHYGALRLATRSLEKGGPQLSPEDAVAFADEVGQSLTPRQLTEKVDGLLKRALKEDFGEGKPLPIAVAWRLAVDSANTSAPEARFDRFQSAHKIATGKLDPESVVAFAESAATYPAEDKRFSGADVQASLKLYGLASAKPQDGGLGLDAAAAQRYVDLAFANENPGAWALGFEKAYRYALNGYTAKGEVAAKPRRDGLNLSPAAALRFAEGFAGVQDMDAALAKHWKIYSYAREGVAGNTLGLDESRALEFVRNAQRRPDVDRYLASHEALYKFAKRKVHLSGLGKEDYEALSFASARAEQVPEGEPRDYIARYRAAMEHAKLAKASGGRGMSVDEAIAFADTQATPAERNREYFAKLAEQILLIRGSANARHDWRQTDTVYPLAEKILAGPNWKAELEGRREVLTRSLGQLGLPNWDMAIEVAHAYGSNPQGYEMFARVWPSVSSFANYDGATPTERIAAAVRIAALPNAMEVAQQFAGAMLSASRFRNPGQRGPLAVALDQLPAPTVSGAPANTAGCVDGQRRISAGNPGSPPGT